MENVAAMLDHLQAALDIADREHEHLIGAYLSFPIQILVERLAKYDSSGPSPMPGQ